MNFKIALFFAKLGFFKYDGAMAFAEHRGIPMARVLYPAGVDWDGGRNYPAGQSVPMAIGNAVNYAKLFNGTVVPLEKRTHGC